MATNISWWILAAFLAAGLAGGALRLGLVRNWAGFGGVVLLGIVAVFAAWSEGRTIEAALGVTAGALFLGALLPDVFREVAHGIFVLVRWLAPIVVGFVALAYYVSAFGPDQTGKDLAGLIFVAIIVTAIRSGFRLRRQNRRNGERR